MGRHNLITRGWTKLGAHARSNTSVFKTTAVFFSDKYGFNVLPLSLQSASYSCPHRTSRFLEDVATTRTTTMLACNTTNHEISCASTHQMPCLTLWESTLRFTAAVASGFCAIVATCVLASITSSNYVGGIPCVSTCNQVVSTSRLPLTSRTW